MMARIAFLNPNATERMTQEMVDVARANAGEACQVVGYTNTDGPPAIQGAADAEASLPGLAGIASNARQAGADALVIGCFDDTGLTQLRRRFDCPVIGLGEAGCILAALTRSEFAVVTTTEGSVPEITRNIETMGLAPRCRAVVPAHVPVLALPERVETVREVLQSTATRHPGVALVLGCAGMSKLSQRLASGLAAPVIDPVVAAVGLAQSTVQVGRQAARPDLERSA